MLPRSRRIKTEYFPAVVRGTTLQNDLFRVVVRRDRTLSAPKCAVIVSLKLSKTAVQRNRIRRQVYVGLEKIMPELPVAFISVFPKRALLEEKEILQGLWSLFKETLR